jgi:hypothetical protein
VYTSPEYNFSVNPVGGSLINFINNGDVDCYPELWITKVGAGTVSITNQSSGQYFEINNLQDGEVVYFDNENEYIQSSLTGVTRYNDFNDSFLGCPRGVNNLSVLGNCKIEMRYQFKLLQG